MQCSIVGIDTAEDRQRFELVFSTWSGYLFRIRYCELCTSVTFQFVGHSVGDAVYLWTVSFVSSTNHTQISEAYYVLKLNLRKKFLVSFRSSFR